MTLVLRFDALSDVGRVRRDNQDSGYAGPHLLVIADGVGGAARGDVASSATIEALRKLDAPPGNDPLSELAGTIHLAHDRLAEIVEQHPDLDGTSTTVTAGVFDGTRVSFGHVGDSRGYLLRDGELKPLTTDHTLVQSLIDEGRITEAEARVHPHRNLILRAVDGVHEPEPDLFTIEVLAGDRFLLCSDGCSGALENADMAELMTGPLSEASQRLVRCALDAGSSDNVTVILADVVEADAEPVAAGLVVGAAASSPHLRMDESTGNLTERDLADLNHRADPIDLDPEDLRYAPRAPRRFTWFGRLLVLLVIGGLAGGGGYAFYDWSQDQYYVDLVSDEVVVYRGLNIDLPLLNEPFIRTGIDISDLPDDRQASLRSGPNLDDVAAARAYVADIRAECAAQLGAAEPGVPLNAPYRDLAPWLRGGPDPAGPLAGKCGSS